MERKNWIETILNSANGITPVTPSDALFSRIQQKIKHESNVSPQTVWLVAASIAILVMLNFSVLASKTKGKASSTATYLEMTVNKSNQLY